MNVHDTDFIIFYRAEMQHICAQLSPARLAANGTVLVPVYLQESGINLLLTIIIVAFIKMGGGLLSSF